ncbi:MAG: glutamate racemase, partial [Kiritimatiellaeota bacterium]|nr:glutamate racemase [Kiritimatiellota bacterium]
MIGFIDSGVGGLCVWQEVVRLLPQEDTLYIADSAHCPYGRKSPDEIYDAVLPLVSSLVEEGCKLVVIACNTATAAAIEALREAFPDVPFVGMEPAVKPAALNSRTGVIGILATDGTLHGRLFNETSARFAKNVRIVSRAGDGLVELVEAGKADAPETRRLLETYLRPMLEEGIDHLVLGCTHFAFLTNAMRAICGEGVTLLDPAPAVARRGAAPLPGPGGLLGSPSPPPP